MKVRKGIISDLKDILQLEYRLYPEQWHVSQEFAKEVLTRNDDVIRVLDVNGMIKGHYAFLPLEKTIYEQILHGEMDEKELAEHILSYKEARNVYLYWTTVMVDIEDPDRTQLSRCLLNDIPQYLQGLKERGINIVEIGGIFISEQGIRVAKRFGMKQTGMIQYIDGKTYPIYRTSFIH
ncbi:MAG TPA: hypothetical protein VNM45_19845 [Bacillus sp. (in: firmicutes)]|nr:hypothetical protein [Bacillus sp. (in: firmicutes)]